MKLKDRPAMLVALFRNTCGEDYAQDIHLHPFYIIHSHEDFIERFMKRPDENEEGEMGKDPDSVYEFKRTRSWWKLKDEDSEDGEIIDFEPRPGLWLCAYARQDSDSSGERRHRACQRYQT